MHASCKLSVFVVLKRQSKVQIVSPWWLLKTMLNCLGYDCWFHLVCRFVEKIFHTCYILEGNPTHWSNTVTQQHFFFAHVQAHFTIAISWFLRIRNLLFTADEQTGRSVLVGRGSTNQCGGHLCWIDKSTRCVLSVCGTTIQQQPPSYIVVICAFGMSLGYVYISSPLILLIKCATN